MTKSEQEAKNRKPWKFEKQMEFLKHFVQCDREETGNIQPSTPTASTSSDVEGDIIDTEDASAREPTPDAYSPSSGISSDTRKKRRVSLRQLSPSAAAFQEYINYKKSKENKPPDHLHKYFASIEETVRTFPLRLQIKIKSEISSILHRAEYEAMSYTARPNNIQCQPSQSIRHSQLQHFTPYDNSQPSSQHSTHYNNSSEPSYHTLQPSSLTYNQHQSYFHTPTENENDPST